MTVLTDIIILREDARIHVGQMMTAIMELALKMEMEPHPVCQLTVTTIQTAMLVNAYFSLNKKKNLVYAQ